MGLNPRFFFDTATEAILFNCSPNEILPVSSCRHRRAKHYNEAYHARFWGGMIPCWRDQLLLRSHQSPISMRLGARLSGTKLTFFSRLSATSGTPHSQSLFLGDSHGYIMRVHSAARWSIVNSALEREPNACCALRELFPLSLKVTAYSPPVRRPALQLDTFCQGQRISIKLRAISRTLRLTCERRPLDPNWAEPRILFSGLGR